MNKKIVLLILIIILVGVLTFIVINKKDNNDNKKQENNKEEVINDKKNNNYSISDNSLILYFSVTNNTKTVAELLKNEINSDIVEIIPKDKYTEEDIDYGNDESRATKEQNDKSARPEIENDIDISKYDTIYLGYPIWWGDVPKIILSLLDKYNFENKTVVVFCTSGSTDIDKSFDTLSNYNKKINFIKGKRFSSSASSKEIEKWVDDLKKEYGSKEITLSVNDNNLAIELENNSSSIAFYNKLKEGNITVDAEDYGNFEKVGNLGFSLPSNDEEYTTSPGDLILYDKDKITLYYDENTYNFTLLGHVKDISQDELKNILGKGNVKMTFKISE